MKKILPAHRPSPWYICLRVQACKAPLQWPTGTAKTVPVGHDNDVAPAQNVAA
jgi:hypothetical protein